MRQTNNSTIIEHDGKFIGIDLGADYCSEHECGIAGIKSDFNLDSSKYGVDRRKINRLPNSKAFYNSYAYVRNKTKSFILFTNNRIIKEVKDGKENKFYFNLSTNLKALWDENEFALVTKKHHKEFEELNEAFQKKDIVIGLFGGHVFKNAGLTILIASRIPEEIKDSLYNQDKDVEKLNKAAKATKIEKILEKAGKGYYALSPKWIKDIGNITNSQYEVVFWLNPMEQQKYKYGWYTVEELIEWSNDKGPIIKGEQ